MTRISLLLLPLLVASCVTTRHDNEKLPPPAPLPPPPPLVNSTTPPGTVSTTLPGTAQIPANGLPPVVQDPVAQTPNPPVQTAAVPDRRYARPIPGRTDAVVNPYNPSGAPIKIKNLSDGRPDYTSGAELYNPGSNRSQIIVIP